MFMAHYYMNEFIKCLPIKKNPDRKWWQIGKPYYVRAEESEADK